MFGLTGADRPVNGQRLVASMARSSSSSRPSAMPLIVRLTGMVGWIPTPWPPSEDLGDSVSKHLHLNEVIIGLILQFYFHIVDYKIIS